MPTDDTEDEPTPDGADEDRPAGTGELVAYLDAQYGDRFDEERLDELTERVADLRETGETLAEEDLSNGDEPAFAFRAYRGEE